MKKSEYGSKPIKNEETGSDSEEPTEEQLEALRKLYNVRLDEGKRIPYTKFKMPKLDNETGD